MCVEGRTIPGILWHEPPVKEAVKTIRLDGANMGGTLVHYDTCSQGRKLRIGNLFVYQDDRASSDWGWGHVMHTVPLGSRDLPLWYCRGPPFKSLHRLLTGPN